MEQTSLLAFQELYEVLSARETEVFELIRRFPDSTDQDLKDLAGREDPNYVRPRRKALLDYGIIECSGKRRYDETGRMAECWRLKSYRLEEVKLQKEKLKNKDAYYKEIIAELQQQIEAKKKEIEGLRKKLT